MGRSRTLSVLLMLGALSGITNDTEAKVFRVIKIVAPISYGGESVSPWMKDYFLNIGTEDGVRMGMVLNIYRPTYVEDRFTGGNVDTLHIPVGRVKLDQVKKSMSLAKLHELVTVEDPIRKRDPVMMGDYVRPSYVLVSEALFNSGEGQLRPEAGPTLHKAAQFIGSFPTYRIVIEGHTDSDGDDAYNMALSERRARSVREYFITQKELPPKKFSIEGYGETRPIAPNDTPEGKAKNRRIEIVVQE